VISKYRQYVPSVRHKAQSYDRFTTRFLEIGNSPSGIYIWPQCVLAVASAASQFFLAAALVHEERRALKLHSDFWATFWSVASISQKRSDVVCYMVC